MANNKHRGSSVAEQQTNNLEVRGSSPRLGDFRPAFDGNDSVQCGFRHDGQTEKSRCTHPAAYRSATVARCEVHGGHHDYTEKLIDGAWVAMPQCGGQS